MGRFYRRKGNVWVGRAVVTQLFIRLLIRLFVQLFITRSHKAGPRPGCYSLTHTWPQPGRELDPRKVYPAYQSSRFVMLAHTGPSHKPRARIQLFVQLMVQGLAWTPYYLFKCLKV